MTDQTIYHVAGEADEFKLASANARATIKFMWRELLWERRRKIKGVRVAAIKVAFAVQSADPTDPPIENMWLTHLDFDGNMIVGKLMNQPRWVTSKNAGDVLSIPPDEVIDWIYIFVDQPFGGFTVDVIRAGMSEAERADHDAQWGIDFGTPGKVRVAVESEPIDTLASASELQALDVLEHPASRHAPGLVESLLHEDPKVLTAPDEQGWLALQRDALAGNVAMVSAWLQHGADPLTTAPNGSNALQLAELGDWPQTYALLASHSDTRRSFPLWPIGLAITAMALIGLYFTYYQPLMAALAGQRFQVSDGMGLCVSMVVLGYGIVSCTGPWYFRLRQRTPLWGKSRALDLGGMLLMMAIGVALREHLQWLVWGQT